MRGPTVRIDGSLRQALAAFDADRLRWLDAAAALGPVSGLRLGPSTVWVVSDAAAIRTMLVSDGDAWTRPPAMRVPIRVGVGENLFTQNDKAWARLQPQVAPAFRKRALDARLASLDSVLGGEVAALPLHETIDLELAMGRIALLAAAWVLLGERLDRDRATEVALHQREVVASVGRRLGKLSAGIPLPLRDRAVREHRRALFGYADEVIARAQRQPHRDDDVLGALLSARPSLRPSALRGQVLGLLLAGNETTAAALSWALVHGSRAPHEWARLRSEPERARLFVDETLRVTPAVWGFVRAPTRKGVTLQAGERTVPVRRTEVAAVYLRAVNRDADTWPDPERFVPDRHRDPHEERSLLPFGLGPRGCIGQHMARAEMVAALPLLARRGDICVAEPVVEDARFALRASGGLYGRFT